jgi:hypothetical protein
VPLYRGRGLKDPRLLRGEYIPVDGYNGLDPSPLNPIGDPVADRPLERRGVLDLPLLLRRGRPGRAGRGGRLRGRVLDLPDRLPGYRRYGLRDSLLLLLYRLLLRL